MSDVKLPEDIKESPFALKKIANAMRSKYKRLERLEPTDRLSSIPASDKDKLLMSYMKQNTELLIIIAELQSALVSEDGE